MDWPAISERLARKGLISGGNAKCEGLSGGVSSDIFLITDGDSKFVLKRVLARLKVKDIWEADISRNQVEQDFIYLAEKFLPGAVPKVLHSDPEFEFFLMEYLDDSYANWKTQLMQGIYISSTALRIAEILATIHSRTQNKQEIAAQFDTTDNFKSLRIEPYLITTGARNPGLKDLFHSEANRLEKHREALVHGDFSPKNFLVGPNRVVLLDHEVAWYGDPAFDLAFLFTHLYFKMLINRERLNELPNLLEIVWKKYFGMVEIRDTEGLKERSGRLLLMIMLARLDGKSPVEYWQKGSRSSKFIRSFVYDVLPAQNFGQEHLRTKWVNRIQQWNS